MKALACQLPAESGIPLSRFSCADIRREVVSRGIVAEISETTIWRWLGDDALRLWYQRSWVFPRDPDFVEKAGRVLDLYAGVWEGQPLEGNDFVISADEKTQIQIRQRRHPITPPAPGQPQRVEYEYRRRGICVYLAAWDVRRARLFGRVAEQCTIVAFDQLVTDVMSQEPYRSADRVFWVVDNGTVHRGQRACERLRAQWPNLVLVHLPIHASWLNQVEIYFSILQRKALTPDHFISHDEVAERILGFQAHYQHIARPFEWKFTRLDLAHTMAKLPNQPSRLKSAA